MFACIALSTNKLIGSGCLCRLYPVDKTRVNEYGISYDEADKGDKGKAHKD